MVKITVCPDMTLAVYCGHKATDKSINERFSHDEAHICEKID